MRQERSTLLDTPGGAALSLSQLEVTLRLCIAYRWSHSLIVSVSFALDFFFFPFCIEYVALQTRKLYASFPYGLHTPSYL